MSSLVHCIYVSTASPLLSVPELELLVQAARIKNQRLGVTGILLSMAGRYFQVLEGESAVVETLYRTIEQDPRHEQVTQIIFESIHARSFDDWCLGMVDLSGNKLRQIISMSDPENGSSSIAHLHEGRTKKLLLAFCEGRWGQPGFDSGEIPL